MKRLAWLAVGSLLIGSAFASSVEGCGGSDDSVANGNDASGGGDGTIGNDDGGSGGDTGTGGDGGTTTDGGRGGPVSNPGSATCGPTLTCDVDAGNGGGNNPYCCERPDGGDSCETVGAACSGVTFRLQCDESADCPANKHDCCMNTSSIGPGPDASIATGNAQCNDHCGGGDLQLCKTAAECGDGGVCALVTCRGGAMFYACNTNDDCK